MSLELSENPSANAPKDISEVPSTLGLISFGSLLIPSIDGVSVRGDINEENNQVVAVSFEHQGSILQVTPFATAKSEQVWPEIMDQLKEGIVASGGSASETEGSTGKQLNAVVPAGQDSAKIRFIGFDGPRWFLRGVISGAAIDNQIAAKNMEDIFCALIVNRGDIPLPPKEPLPLKLPDGTIAPPKFSIK